MIHKCYAVQLKHIIRVSDKSCLAVDIAGKKAFVPMTHIFSENGSAVIYLSEWILAKKGLKYERKNPKRFYSGQKCDLSLISHKKS